MENKSIVEQVAELSELQAKHLLLMYLENKTQLQYRLAVINEDAEGMRDILKSQGLFDDEAECFTLLNNIQIACDLSSDESLSWTLTNTTL
jgi:hypothetical protein